MADRKAYLAPSILSADFSKLEEQVALIEKGGADYVHMDVMDGRFVPNITFGGPVVQNMAGKTKMPFDVHLMIVHPEERLKDFVTPQTEYITVHEEAALHLNRLIQQIKSLGVKAGVALNPSTTIASTVLFSNGPNPHDESTSVASVSVRSILKSGLSEPYFSIASLNEIRANGAVDAVLYVPYFAKIGGSTSSTTANTSS